MKFSKQHERDEARLLRKGCVRSWIGLLLSWLPVVGLLFAAGGFFRCKVRLTRRHRRRRTRYLVFASVVLALAVGLNMAELWVYSRDPQIVERLGQRAWRFVVGKNADLTDDAPHGGTDYPDMDSAGLGVPDGALQEESDGLDGDFTGWDDGFDWDAWNDDTGANAAGGETWPGEAGVDWYIDDSWDFDSDGLFWPEDTLSEPKEAGDGLDWDLDALFEEGASGAQRSLNVGKGEAILPLSE